MNAERRVLVVDDDPAVTKSFDRVLSTKGYAVITASSGEEALAKLQNEHYDAVFTDIRMPGMNGVEVAQRVKASQPWMPVVIVTGYGTEAYQRQAEAAGVTQFLNKPLSPEMIEESIEQALYVEPAQPGSDVHDLAAYVEDIKVEVKARSHAMDVLLFFAAPFIGLLYVMFMPFVGLGVLAWMAIKALRESKKARLVASFIAAPFVGLAFITVGPFAALGALAYVGVKETIFKK
jgi:CheY-like chemotaxis protein